MKVNLLLLPLLCMAINLRGQKNKISEKDSPNSIFNCYYTRLNKKKVSGKKQFPYKKIIVIDARPDTTKCGYWLPHIDNSLEKLCLNNGLRQNASDYLKNYIKNNLNSEGNSVLACIKKCWIRTYDSSGLYYKTNFKVEFYEKTESAYYPLYRFDSLFFHKREFKMDPAIIIEEALIASIRNLYEEQHTINEMRELSFSQIDSFNNQSGIIPVLKEKSVPKGLYLSFSQFRNKEPAYTDFEMNFDELADAIFVKGADLKDSVIIDAWGVSDGEHLYMRMGKKYFPLFRVGSTFDLYGYDRITESRFYPGQISPFDGTTSQAVANIGLEGLLSLIKTKSKNLKPYQLDMETGEIQ